MVHDVRQLYSKECLSTMPHRSPILQQDILRLIHNYTLICGCYAYSLIRYGKIKGLKQTLSNEFEMKGLGATNLIFGMRINKDRFKCVLRLSQEYIKKILKRFIMDDALL